MRKQVKVLILLIMAFVVSGCTAEVNVEIGYDSIDETISINATNLELNNGGRVRQYLPAYFEDLPGDEEDDVQLKGIKYYDYSKTNTLDGSIIKYHFNYPFMKYRESTSINKLFSSSLIGVSEEDNSISIVINEGLTRDGKIKPVRIFDTNTSLTEIRVNVRSKLKVLYSNADIEEDGVYTWVFNNYQHDKVIEMDLDRGDADIHQVSTTKHLRVKDLTSTAKASDENNDENKEISPVSKVIIWIWIGIIGAVLLFVIGSLIKKGLS